MNNLEWGVVIDLAVLIYGIYILFSAISMKRTGKVSSIVASADEMKKCKDTNGLISVVMGRMIGFGIIAIAYGIFAAVGDWFFALPFIVKAGGLLVFIVGCYWLVSGFRKAREQFLP